MTENSDCSGMSIIGPLLCIAIANSALARPGKEEGTPHRALLEAELAKLADGFTVFDAAGRWRGTSETSLLYIVSLPHGRAERLLDFLRTFRASIGEDALFVGVGGLGLLVGMADSHGRTEGQRDAHAA